MNTKNLTRSLMAACAIGASFVSCSDDEDFWNEVNGPNPEKEVISFTGDNGSETTRAFFAGTRAGLHESNDTKILMRIKSEDIESTTGGHTKGADRFTRTVALATKEQAADHTSSTFCNTLNETHSDVTFAEGNYRYWDDAFGRYGKLSVYAVAIPGYKDDTTLPNTTLTEGSSTVSTTNTSWFTETTEDETLTWSVPTNAQTTETIAKRDLCYSNNISSSGTKGVYKQSYSSADKKWTTSLTDGQLLWQSDGITGSTAGKFDQGNLIFKHALCKITINLTEGNGFNNSANTDFNFKTNTNVELLGFPYESKLDLATGTWSAASGTLKSGTISKLQETTAATVENKTTRTVVGLTLPDRVLKDNGSNNKTTENALHFVIDDNDYYVTCDQIATAIQTYYTTGAGSTSTNANTLKTFTTMTQGQHYVINITVGKTKIDNITAQLIAWEEVNTAEIDPSNAYIAVSLENRSSNASAVTTNNFNLYRSPVTYDLDATTSYASSYNANADYDWKKGYETTAATKTWDNTNSKWQTDWYWPDNKTYYHIRALGDAATTSPAPPTLVSATGTATDDTFVIKSGNLTGTSDYKDYIWGAPFLKNDGADFTYSLKSGFDGTGADETTPTHQIYKAIGPTNNTINMLLFHMTSQVFFEVQTTTGEDKVALQKTVGEGESATTTNTKVELLKFYKEGTVLIGNGLVNPTAGQSLTANQEIEFASYTAGTTTGTAKPAVSKHQYGVVPQILNRVTSGTEDNTYKVGIRITTPDGNQYVIEDISTVLSKAITENNIKNPYSTKKTSGSDTYYQINRWYPGYQYTYTVTLKKTGIASITAQLVDWETVTGDLGTIDLEGTN